MIVKDVNNLKKNNFIISLLRELCKQNISYVLIDDMSDDKKKCLELHFDKYIYRFHEISCDEIEKSFMQNPFEVLAEVSFTDRTFVDDSMTLEIDKTTKKKGKSGNKRYTKKDMRKDKNNYKTSRANYKLR